MNRNKILWALLPLLLVFLFACKKSDDNPGGNNVTPPPGSWKITYFFDKNDETANYAGYTFEFGANGNLNATTGIQDWPGSWQTGIDDSANKLLIDFSGAVPSALSDLEEDWRIITISDTFMHLEHTSGGNGDTDVVKFTKI